MSTYRKDIDETKCVPFLIKDDELLKSYNEIWKKLKVISKIKLDSQPVCNEKHLKAKIKSYNGKSR